jgi:hypothetical protein
LMTWLCYLDAEVRLTVGSVKVIAVGEDRELQEDKEGFSKNRRTRSRWKH